MAITNRYVEKINAAEYRLAVEDGAEYIVFAPTGVGGGGQTGMLWQATVGRDGRVGFPSDPNHPFNTYSRIVYDSRELLLPAESKRKRAKAAAGAKKKELTYDDQTAGF